MYPLAISLIFSVLPLTLGLSVLSRSGSTGDPVITVNFPDPCVIQATNGTWFAFSTSAHNLYIPMATSADYKTWHMADGHVALPSVGKWNAGGGQWAPDVIKVEGGYAMYYAGKSIVEKTHCIGVATSKNIEGPYEPSDSPLVCSASEGGVIDPAGFRDSDNSLYLVWKVDGNSIGHGGVCGNSVEPIVPTPIRIRQLNPDGKSFKDGISEKEILNRDSIDGPLVEAPSLVRSKEGVYFLFFSSNCYSGPNYDIAYATATNVLGPYTKGPWLMKTGNPYSNLYAPGGADVTPDGTKLVFHADNGTSASVRQMYAIDIQLSGKTVKVV